ncbi:hypothetical protein [Pedobacter sp.]|uniref:hypothetical protein n=1 Tax=Pedobacter sp. TaxID=1411316 RepID=UPI003D7F2939
MKTLPYLKQLTYGTLIVCFPFIFSASKDKALPQEIVRPLEKHQEKVNITPEETIKTIKVTLDSLKQSSNTLLKKI